MRKIGKAGWCSFQVGFNLIDGVDWFDYGPRDLFNICLQIDQNFPLYLVLRILAPQTPQAEKSTVVLGLLVQF